MTTVVIVIFGVVALALTARIEIWMIRRDHDAMAEAFEEADDQAAHWREQARLKDRTWLFLMEEIATRDRELAQFRNFSAEEFTIPARDGEAS